MLKLLRNSSTEWVGERKHQHQLNDGRALLYQEELPKFYWCHDIMYATFIINRVPTKTLQNQSSYQKLYEKILDIDSFKVFGSLCYEASEWI